MHWKAKKRCKCFSDIGRTKTNYVKLFAIDSDSNSLRDVRETYFLKT